MLSQEDTAIARSLQEKCPLPPCESEIRANIKPVICSHCNGTFTSRTPFRRHLENTLTLFACLLYIQSLLTGRFCRHGIDTVTHDDWTWSPLFDSDVKCVSPIYIYPTGADLALWPEDENNYITFSSDDSE